MNRIPRDCAAVPFSGMLALPPLACVVYIALKVQCAMGASTVLRLAMSKRLRMFLILSLYPTARADARFLRVTRGHHVG
jgi:hypothetical protein